MTKKHDLELVVDQYAQLCNDQCKIDPTLFDRYEVKRGLRDKSGQGVLAGLTKISHIQAFDDQDGALIPCEGKLYYRGYEIKDLTRGFLRENRYGFEEIAYLLLLGNLPREDELEQFKDVLAGCRTLPTNFVRDVIMKAPSQDIMNSLSKSVLTLASYSKDPSDISISAVLSQCLMLISVFPMLSVYSYQAYNHYIKDDSLYIHRPDKNLSTAENFLRMLRPDMQYTSLEAMVLDLAMVLHMEHGGGNNSTFTTHVVTSSGTDTYSTMVAALCSLDRKSVV